MPQRLSQPFLRGVRLGFGLGFLIVLVAFLTGRLEDDDFFDFFPAFIGLGLVAYVWVRLRLRRDGTDGRPAEYALGLAAGGTVAGAIAVWSTFTAAPLLNRTVLAVFGGAILAGFWMFLGGILAGARGSREA